MSELIFCLNCGLRVGLNDSCKCGSKMTVIEKNKIQNKIQSINNYQIVESKFKKLAKANLSKVTDYKLSNLYFLASSAKEDYQSKVDFIQNNIISNLHSWTGEIKAVDKLLAQDRVRIFSKVVGITEFVLTEFFGKFAVAKTGKAHFVEYYDFGKYNMTSTIRQANISFSDVQKTDFGTIGVSVMNSVENTLKTGSFKNLSKKSEWSKTDIDTVKYEVAAAAIEEIVKGIVKVFNENSKAIREVRKGDLKLNKTIEKINNGINSLTITENELLKQKKLLHTNEFILDSCFENVLKPIFDELQNDEVYKEYKVQRMPHELRQKKIQLEKNILKRNVTVSFWGCLINSKASNYRRYWLKRARPIQISNYQKLNTELDEKNHISLIDSVNYSISKTEDYKDFELISRRVLKKQPAIMNNKDKVIQFAGILKIIKSNLIK